MGLLSRDARDTPEGTWIEDGYLLSFPFLTGSVFAMNLR